MPAQRKTNQSRGLAAAGLIAVTAATLLMMAWAIFPTAAFAATKPISVSIGSLSGHGCDDSEWHFVINQLADFNGDGKINEADAPASIHVTWANLVSADVLLDGVNGHEASYTTKANLDSTVTGATAIIDSSWTGQFVLSHGPCETPEQGRIEIEKKTVPSGDPATFGFTGDLTSTLGDGDTDGTAVDPGTYHVTESAKTGWALTNITCTDPTNDSSGVLATGIATFNVAPGETVHCTFTNTKNATTTTTPGGGGGGGTTTTPPPAPTTTTTTPSTVAPTTIHNTSTTHAAEVLPTTVRPGKLAFTGIEDVVPIGALALTLMTTGSGLLWAGSRRRRHDGSGDED